MQYKTELHAHTKEVSPCGDLTGAELTERYLDAGFTTVVLTNHFCERVIRPTGETWQQQCDFFLNGWRVMKEYAKDRLHVLLGCELRFTENDNDYLIIGMTERFLYDHPDLFDMGIRNFAPLARENGMLIVQAHPFRNGIVMTDSKHLDGIEVFNGHPKHDARNYLADEYAKRKGLIRTSGSDFHHPHHQAGVAGIMTDFPITTQKELLATLRGGDYTLICRGEAAERDGMQDMPAKI